MLKKFDVKPPRKIPDLKDIEDYPNVRYKLNNPLGSSSITTPDPSVLNPIILNVSESNPANLNASPKSKASPAKSRKPKQNKDNMNSKNNQEHPSFSILTNSSVRTNTLPVSHTPKNNKMSNPSNKNSSLTCQTGQISQTPNLSSKKMFTVSESINKLDGGIEKNIEINTFCKNKHDYQNKLTEKDKIMTYVERLGGKLLRANIELNKQKDNSDGMSESNLQMIFNHDKLLEDNMTLRKLITFENGVIDKLRSDIMAYQKESNEYAVEVLQLKDDIEHMNDSIKKLRKNVDKEIKINNALKYEVQNIKSEIVNVKNALDPDKGRYDEFIRDVTKLISIK